MGGIPSLPGTPASSLLSEPGRHHRQHLGSWATEAPGLDQREHLPGAHEPGAELAQDRCSVSRGEPWALTHHSLVNRSMLTAGRTEASGRSMLTAGHTEASGQAVLPQLWRHIKPPVLLSSNGRPALGEPERGPDALAQSLEVRGVQCMEFSIVSDTMSPLWPWS